MVETVDILKLLLQFGLADKGCSTNQRTAFEFVPSQNKKTHICCGFLLLAV